MISCATASETTTAFSSKTQRSPKTIRLSYNVIAHNVPWRIAVEQGFFTDEGLDIKAIVGSSSNNEENYKIRTKESTLVEGYLDVYPVCEWGAIKRVHELGHSRILSTDATIRKGAIIVLADSPVKKPEDLAGIPIAVTWNAGSHYASIEALEQVIPLDQIHLVHTENLFDALIYKQTEAVVLMEPWLSKAEAAGARRILEMVWKGNIVVGQDIDADTGKRILRALQKSAQWLKEDPVRGRKELLIKVFKDHRPDALVPEVIVPGPYSEENLRETFDWMEKRNLISGEFKNDVPYFF